MEKSYRLNASFAYKEFCSACLVNVRAIVIHRDGSATLQVAESAVQRLAQGGAEIVREWRDADYTVQVRLNTVAPYATPDAPKVRTSTSSARQAEASFEQRMQAKQKAKLARLLAEVDAEIAKASK